MTSFPLRMGSALSSVWDYTKWLFGYENEPVPSYPALTATPFVYKRRGSMYIDEDGDLAHEFYEEAETEDGRPFMRKIEKNLTPQGEVKLPHPRIHVDFPIPMYEG